MVAGFGVNEEYFEEVEDAEAAKKRHAALQTNSELSIANLSEYFTLFFDCSTALKVEPTFLVDLIVFTFEIVRSLLHHLFGRLHFPTCLSFWNFMFEMIFFFNFFDFIVCPLFIFVRSKSLIRQVLALTRQTVRRPGLDHLRSPDPEVNVLKLLQGLQLYLQDFLQVLNMHSVLQSNLHRSVSFALHPNFFVSKRVSYCPFFQLSQFFLFAAFSFFSISP